MLATSIEVYIFLLEPNFSTPYPPSQIYPSFETDRALGQSGYQKIPYDINMTKSLPKNYNETNVTNVLVAICDADGDGHIDTPFKENQTISLGDNHRGYLGYRNITDNSTIIDDGAIHVVIYGWNNKSINEANKDLDSSSICHDTPNPYT